MAGISSAIAIAGSPLNFLVQKSGTILVSRDGRIPQDIICLEPPIPTKEADDLAARIQNGEDYEALGIVSTDVAPKPDNQSRWFMRR